MYSHTISCLFKSFDAIQKLYVRNSVNYINENYDGKCSLTSFIPVTKMR